MPRVSQDASGGTVHANEKYCTFSFGSFVCCSLGLLVSWKILKISSTLPVKYREFVVTFGMRLSNRNTIVVGSTNECYFNTKRVLHFDLWYRSHHLYQYPTHHLHANLESSPALARLRLRSCTPRLYLYSPPQVRYAGELHEFSYKINPK